MTPSGIEPATFRLVAQCLSQLRHRVPSKMLSGGIILKQILKTRLDGAHCIYLVQETYPFLPFANTVLKRRVASSEVFGTVYLRIPLWDMVMSQLEFGYRRFEGTYCLHIQGLSGR